MPMSVPISYMPGLLSGFARTSGKKSGPYQVGILCIAQPGVKPSQLSSVGNAGSNGCVCGTDMIDVVPPKTLPSLNMMSRTSSNAPRTSGESNGSSCEIQALYVSGDCVRSITSSTQSVN